MGFNDGQTHYEVLEVSPDATPQEIRAAYLRAKAAYQKNSPALYTLIDAEETDQLVAQLERAYQVLSNPDLRKQYDQSHGILGAEIDDREIPFPEPPPSNVVSIDRVPPMEDSRVTGDLLVAPSTDFAAAAPPRPTTPSSTAAGAGEPPPFSSPAPAANASASSLAEEIAQESEWRGTTLRRIREARGVSIEELSEFTRISKNYLFALEEENFSKLPAPVFLRGFVIQTAKFLKLPYEKVAAAYMARRASFDPDKK